MGDKNVGISFQRGKKKANGVYSLDDPCSELDNVPGTPRFWQKKKYELIAKLENLGAFQVFFTLSCADLRWHETFTAFLKDHKIRICAEKRFVCHDALQQKSPRVHQNDSDGQ